MVKLPPQNIDYELSVLVSCLLYPDDREKTLDVLSPDDFYKTSHRLVFHAIAELQTKAEPVDITTVMQKLLVSGKLEEVGGASYLAQILDNPAAMGIEYYCNRLIDLASLRKIIEISNKYQQVCFDIPENVNDIIEGIQGDIFKVGDRTKTNNFKDMKEMVSSAVERYQVLSQNKGGLTGIPSGYVDLDFMTCGFQRHDLIILAARPSHGKSAMAVNCITRSAKQGFGAAVYSMEMATSQLADRFMAIESGLNSIKLRSGRIGKDDWLRITEASGALYDLPIWIDDTSNQTYQQIIRKARKLKKKENISQVWIDYLGFVKGDNAKQRVYEVGEITRALKGMAKDLDIPVILLCQLNRKVEDRTNKRPKLADLRDSGEIEQDADVVIFLHRESEYWKSNKESSEYKKWQGIAEVEISKHRNGPTGAIRLAWDESTTEFKDYARRF